jgi:hypothetical protein
MKLLATSVTPLFLALVLAHADQTPARHRLVADRPVP